MLAEAIGGEGVRAILEAKGLLLFMSVSFMSLNGPVRTTWLSTEMVFGSAGGHLAIAACEGQVVFLFL